MKTRKYKILFTIITGAMFILSACETEPEALMIQKPYTYDDQYYENLRAYKESDHQIFYGWYAAYGQKEGVQASYKESASWGEHIAGLPDSLDFCSLWMGIPTEEDNPIAYEEMRRSMEVRGIKMVMPEICRIEKYEGQFELNEDGMREYAAYLVNKVFEHDLDGLDLDYEPEGDWLQDSVFAVFVQMVGESIGPMSINPDKYLIIDYYNHTPPPEVEPYINYLVNQAYTQGITSNSAERLQSRYDQVSWCPPEKFIVTENFGDWWPDGGSPFTEADGNTLTTDGKQMYSLEGMARWNPVQGPKGGFGAFYFDRDYQNLPAYHNVRRCIQIINPAVY
ncbi:MAG: glycoside hydrolase family 18 [Bacteroidales bacterium]|jgi:hypothetical protein|nr:glycoside hydrolase family 18 [Bacteroidales bacterium]